MSPGASPDRRAVVRVSVDEQVTLFLHQNLPDLSQERSGIPAQLIDASPCGARVRHTITGLKANASGVLHSSSRTMPIRAVWSHDAGAFIETGFLTEEAFLLGCLQGGENEALVPLLETHLPRMKSVIRSIVRDRSDAEDVLQDCLLKVMAHARQFHPGQSFRAWLLQIATHDALKLIRSKKRRLQFTQVWKEDDYDDGSFTCVDQRASPADVMKIKEYEAAFSAALGSLDEIYRRVFILRQLQQRTMAEIAAELGINVDTANTRLHRARLRLYFQLQDICPLPMSTRSKNMDR